MVGEKKKKLNGTFSYQATCPHVRSRGVSVGQDAVSNQLVLTSSMPCPAPAN